MGNKHINHTDFTLLEIKATNIPTQKIFAYQQGFYDRIGSDDPNWQLRLKGGGQAGNNMIVTTQESVRGIQASAFAESWTLPNPKIVRYSMEGQHAPPAYVPYPTDLTSWENEASVVATVKFLRRVREADRHFQAGVFFGEIVPTLRMLKRPFSSLRDGIRRYFDSAVRRTRGTRGPTRLKILGDTWLEFAFGWRPLLGDIKDASQDLMDVYTNISRKRVSATHTVDIALPTSADYLYRINNMFFDILRFKEVGYSVKFYGGLLPLPNADLGLPYLQKLIKMSDFKLESFIPTAWELIPYSFLVDYFINVSQVLDAYSTDVSSLTYVSSVEIRDATQISYVNYNIPYTFKFFVGFPSGNPPTQTSFAKLGGNGGTCGARWRRVTRIAYGSLTYPGLRFNSGISAFKIANIVALLSGSRRLPTSSG